MNWILAAWPPPDDAPAPLLALAEALAPPPPFDPPPLDEPQAVVTAASPITAHVAATLNR
jgi:hypothetical protein